MLTVTQNDDEAPGLAPLRFLRQVHGEQIRKFNGKLVPLPDNDDGKCPGLSGTIAWTFGDRGRFSKPLRSCRVSDLGYTHP